MLIQHFAARSVVLREGRDGAAPALGWGDDAHWARVTWSLLGTLGAMRVLPATLHAAPADADGNILVRTWVETLPTPVCSAALSLRRPLDMHLPGRLHLGTG